MLPPPLSLKITYLGAFWTLFQLKSLHKLSSSKPFGVGTWGTAYWFICWHKVSMKSVTQSKWILCIYKLIKYGICMWKTLFFQPRDNAWCGCGFAFCLENPEITEHGSPWAGNLEPAPSFWNLKFSVCQRRNEGSGLISEAWQWEFRLPLKFGLRLSNSPRPLTLWRCCMPPGSSLLQQAGKRPGVREPKCSQALSEPRSGFCYWEGELEDEAETKRQHRGWKDKSLSLTGLSQVVGLTVSFFS